MVKSGSRGSIVRCNTKQVFHCLMQDQVTCSLFDAGDLSHVVLLFDARSRSLVDARSRSRGSIV